MMHLLRAERLRRAPVREYGRIEVNVDNSSKLFQNVSPKTICWMSHNDYISKSAPGFRISAWTADCPVAAAENEEKNFMQYSSIGGAPHPGGNEDAFQFCIQCLRLLGDWKMDSFVKNPLRRSVRSGRRQSAVRAFRRRGFLSGGGASVQGCGEISLPAYS